MELTINDSLNTFLLSVFILVVIFVVYAFGYHFYFLLKDVIERIFKER